MDKLQSIKDNINLHVADLNIEDSEAVVNCTIWLEGWICGATDTELHPDYANLREKAIDYLKEVIK